MKRTKKSNRAPEPQYPVVVETFREPSYFSLSGLVQREPDAFNGAVHVRRWRVTVELIEEPREVLFERLQKLWDECDNHHLWQPLRAAAERIGYSFTEHAGSKRRRR
jgi:hypothetical protein